MNEYVFYSRLIKLTIQCWQARQVNWKFDICIEPLRPLGDEFIKLQEFLLCNKIDQIGVFERSPLFLDLLVGMV